MYYQTSGNNCMQVTTVFVVVCLQPLQTVWTLNRALLNDMLMVFVKEFMVRVNFEKKSDDSNV